MNDSKWRELCRQIMTEQDPDRLWQLVEELNKTLEQRDGELRFVDTRAQPRDAETDVPDDST